MGYPQPNSNLPAINGQNAWRLTTPLFGGDIYESEQGAQAFAIGPNSDISDVVVSYFDDTQSPTYMSQIEVTPQRPFIGAVPSRLDPSAKYQPSGRQGRIFITPRNIYNPNWVPRLYNIGNQDKFRPIIPVLDFIQYFTQPPSIPVRDDRIYDFENFQIPNPGTGTLWVAVPFFGRAYAYTSFFCQASGGVTYGVRSVTFTINDGTASSGSTQNQEADIVAAALVADGNSVTKVIQSNTDGRIDFLLFSFAASVATPNASLKIVLSDTPQ